MHAFGHLLVDRRPPAALILDRWIRGAVRIEFRPLPLAVRLEDRDAAFGRECAALFTERTGRKNLLGSVRQNFEEIAPFILAEFRRRAPRM